MNDHIITEHVSDPEDTVVNFFDYWITEQNANDYQALNSWENVKKGINTNHLFLFAGYFGLIGNTADEANRRDYVGSWNAWTGDGVVWAGPSPTAPVFVPDDPSSPYYKPCTGIVNEHLRNGYPRLDISVDRGFEESTGLDFSGAEQRDESLAYLFAPNINHNGKASYPNVKGLFRIDDEGYYYYDSQKAFAELNREQTGTKTSPGQNGENKITLYDTTWSTVGNGKAGEFFPFNHWDQLFNKNNNGALSQTHNGLRPNNQREQGQNHTGSPEPINHYFGMTMETKFQQPIDGTINRGTGNDIPMTFEFSGDDVWIFVDDVLVGDLGGLHNAARILINFSTGDIQYFGDIEGSANARWNNSSNASDKAGADQHRGEGLEITHMQTTLRKAYAGAGMEDATAWGNGNTANTFANGTIHTLKFFYLERGNDLSNNSLKFNLQPGKTDGIRKVDENGEVLKTAAFDIFEATASGTSSEWPAASEFSKGTLVCKDIKYTEEDGFYGLVDTDGNPLDFSAKGDNAYYILEETKTPDGYRSNPFIILQYHQSTNTFTVVNTFETGAYASFTADWKQIGNKAYSANYTSTNGQLSKKGSDEVDSGALKDGLTIVIPVIKLQDESNNFLRWLPMYGSNTNGWHTITDSYQKNTPSENSQEQFEMDLALAALLQIADNDLQDWYLNWVKGADRLEGIMQSLPGDATRYLVNNPNGDLNLVALFIPSGVLTKLGIQNADNYADDDARYKALQSSVRTALNGNYTEDNIYEFLSDKYVGGGNTDTSDDTFNILYTDEFQRNYQTVIYVPNEQRELRVRKVSEDGTYVNGAVFAIFDTAEHAAAFSISVTNKNDVMAELEGKKGTSGIQAYGITDTVDLKDAAGATTGSQKGMLIFREKTPSTNDNPPGYARIAWPSSRDAKDQNGDAADTVLWLKEIFAPSGYALNDNLVRIEVGNAAIYANATGYKYTAGNSAATRLEGNEAADDGIKVVASLGKLSQTLVKYAVGNSVDATLQDVTISKQVQTGDSNGALDPDRSVWKAGEEGDSFNLHYNTKNASLLTGQYGLHDEDSPDGLYQGLPVFTADDGYIRVMPRQNQTKYADSAHDQLVKRSELIVNDIPIDLDGLFGLMNTVEITDKVELLAKKIETDPGEGEKVEVGQEVTYEISWKTDIDQDEGVTVRITDKLDIGVDFVEASYSDLKLSVATPNDANPDIASPGVVTPSGLGTSGKHNTGVASPSDLKNIETATSGDAGRKSLFDWIKAITTPRITGSAVENTATMFPQTIIVDGREVKVNIAYDRTAHTVTWEFENWPADKEGVVSLTVRVNENADTQWDYADGRKDGEYDHRILNRAVVSINGIDIETDLVENPLMDLGSLKISKTVEGTGGDTNKVFHFSVELTGDDLSGSARPDADDVTWSWNGNTKTWTGKVKLKHGDYITIKTIPIGTSYTVTE